MGLKIEIIIQIINCNKKTRAMKKYNNKDYSKYKKNSGDVIQGMNYVALGKMPVLFNTQATKPEELYVKSGANDFVWANFMYAVFPQFEGTVPEDWGDLKNIALPAGVTMKLCDFFKPRLESKEYKGLKPLPTDEEKLKQYVQIKKAIKSAKPYEEFKKLYWKSFEYVTTSTMKHFTYMKVN